MFKVGQLVKFMGGFGSGWITARVIESDETDSVLNAAGFKYSISNSELFIEEPSLPFNKMMGNLEKRVLR